MKNHQKRHKMLENDHKQLENDKQKMQISPKQIKPSKRRRAHLFLIQPWQPVVEEVFRLLLLVLRAHSTILHYKSPALKILFK